MRQRWIASLSDRTTKSVEHTRILPLSFSLTEACVQQIGIRHRELLHSLDAQIPQIALNRTADPGQIAQAAQVRFRMIKNFGSSQIRSSHKPNDSVFPREADVVGFCMTKILRLATRC